MTRAVLVLAVAAGLLALHPSAGAQTEMQPAGAARPPATAQSVTVSFARFFSAECNCYKARVFGRVSSGAAGEEVLILRHHCGRSPTTATAVASAETREGGFFETEVAFVPGPDFTVSAVYRARWNDRLSEPVVFRGKLFVRSSRARAGVYRVAVSTQFVNPQDLKGRQIVLQRQVDGQWTRVATARLAPHRTLYYTFVATFRVSQRGWTLRAVVPARAAAPCFTQSVSEPWKS